MKAYAVRIELYNELTARLDRQDAFLAGRGPARMIIATFRDIYAGVSREVDDWPEVASRDFVMTQSRRIGRQKWFEAIALFERQREVGDDSLIGGWSPAIDWGTGATAAMFTGLEPVFQRLTSYSPRQVIGRSEDVGRLALDLDNPWIRADIEYWRGFFEVCDGPIPIAGHNFRSPLDLANDLRGNELFLDMHDRPEEVERLVQWCAESISAVDARIRQEVPAMRPQPTGAWGVARRKPGIMFINGDPVDLISVEMGERFNRHSVEALAAYAGGIYFHHHSIGIDRATSVSRIRGFAVQNIIQDPNGPLIRDRIDDALIAASRRVPIDLHTNVARWENADELFERLSHGRFIVRVHVETLEEARRWVAKVRKLNG